MADVTVRKKRNGRYEVRWRETGGQRRGRTFDRSGDADKFATKVRRTQQTAGLVELDVDNPITIGEYVEVWWRRHAMPHLAENTRRVYARVWETHARETLGGVRVKLARTSTFEDLQLALLERDPPVGAETIRKLMTMLQSVMALAVRDDTLPTVTVNVVAAVRRPSAPRRRGLALWPTTVEAIRNASWQTGTKRVRTVTMPQQDAALVSLLAYAGLRPEEALALVWADITARHIRVERAVALGEIRADDAVKRHDRSVRLLQPLAEDLRAWKDARGAIPLPNQLLFSRRDGGVWQDHDWRNWRKRVFQPAAKAAGLVHARPYDLRGSFASLLIQEGRNVVDVAKQLGHTPETCLRYYARLFDEAPEHPVPAEEAIRAARRQFAQERLAV
jgi:integrase